MNLKNMKRNYMGPIARLLKFGKIGSSKENIKIAQDAAYEIEVAYKLQKNGETIECVNKTYICSDNTGKDLKLLNVDIETAKKIIECENFDLSSSLTRAANLKIILVELQGLAINLGKELFLYSKSPIPETVKVWLDKHNIGFYEGNV